MEKLVWRIWYAVNKFFPLKLRCYIADFLEERSGKCFCSECEAHRNDRW